MQLSTRSPYLVVALALLVAVGPIATDLYLPAMPALVDVFSSTVAHVQLTISAFLAGLAIAHLFCGPLADRFGRRPVLAGGLLLFSVASVGCALSSSVDELIFWRLVQGLGACVGPTLGRAVVRDVYGPDGAARVLAYLAMIMACAPAVAPMIGGLLLLKFGWPSLFVLLAIFAWLCLALLLVIPETLPVSQSLHPASILRNYWRLLRSSEFMRPALIAALFYAGIFSFISGAAFVLVGHWGLSPQAFANQFLWIVLGYMGGSLLFTRLCRRYRHDILLPWVSLSGCGFAGLLCTLAWLEVNHPLALMLPAAGYSSVMGMVLPLTMARALRDFPELAGTASALLGFIQMGVSAFAGALVGWVLQGPPLPLALVVLGLAALGTLGVWSERRIRA